MMPPHAERLGERLIHQGALQPEQLRVALYEQQQNGGMLGEILLELGFIPRSTLLLLLQDMLQVTALQHVPQHIPPHLLQRLPPSVARQCLALPVAQQGPVVQVAMADPHDLLSRDMLQNHLPEGAVLQPCLLPAADVLDLIAKHYPDQDDLDRLLFQLDQQRGDDERGHATHKLVDLLLQRAVHARASDIHLEPEDRFVRIRFRIDGTLEQAMLLHADHWPPVAQRLKVLARLNLAHTRLPQDGRFKATVGGQDIDFRISIMPTVWGDNIVLRVLDPRVALRPLADLGFFPDQVALLEKLLARPSGLVLVTGPVGSGKTTTLFALLHLLNKLGRKIVTLEDPVEYQLNFIRQTAVQEAQGLTFGTGVRALLRQDPDVLLIGEMRDADTAHMALRAALTGHRVFSTMHTQDVFGVIPRLFDLGLSPATLAGHVHAIINQRLVRQHCTTCAGRASNVVAMTAQGHGCAACRYTGYAGRTMVAEILELTPAFDDLLLSRAGRTAWQTLAQQHGFQSLQARAKQKMAAGIIDHASAADVMDMDAITPPATPTEMTP